MSHLGPCGRCTPRWSVCTAQAAGGMALCAGLAALMPTVCVAPPLLFNVPRRGFLFTLSVPFLVNEHPAVLPMRLWPYDVGPPVQSGPCGALFAARMVPSSVADTDPKIPPPCTYSVPPLPDALFLTTVSFTRFPGDPTKKPPPSEKVFPPDTGAVALTEFRAMVEFLIVPDVSKTPPASASVSSPGVVV